MLALTLLSHNSFMMSLSSLRSCPSVGRLVDFNRFSHACVDLTLMLLLSLLQSPGIKCPIIPGIMPINNYEGFKRMVGFCKVSVPKSIRDALEPIKAEPQTS